LHIAALLAVGEKLADTFNRWRARKAAGQVQPFVLFPQGTTCSVGRVVEFQPRLFEVAAKDEKVCNGYMLKPCWEGGALDIRSGSGDCDITGILSNMCAFLSTTPRFVLWPWTSSALCPLSSSGASGPATLLTSSGEYGAVPMGRTA
jgi:hypothetical protein